MRNATIEQLASPRFARARFHYRVQFNFAEAVGSIQIPRFEEMVDAAVYRISVIGSNASILAAIPADSAIGKLDTLTTDDADAHITITVHGQWYKGPSGGLLIIQSIVG